MSRYTAKEAALAIQCGDISSLEFAESCLNRLELRESSVQAWEYVDKDLVRSQARDRDSQRKSKPLQGVPIGIKDIIDTADMPTSYGSPFYHEHQPEINAACIERLENAGAIIFGKTVTTEFAYLNPGKTRNPHNFKHTPGGSSSGSAAAVADYHVPLALGTQTAGSIIRPASFCGVVGFKPTFASFPISGIHPFSPSFDTLGGFARSVSDIILLSEVLADRDFDKHPIRPEAVALVHGPYWSQAEPDTQFMFENLTEVLRDNQITVDIVDLSVEFNDINGAHKIIMLSESVQSLKKVYEKNKSDFSDRLLEDYEIAMSYSEKDIQIARTFLKKLKQKVAEVFSEFDLVLTPASPGRAPEGLHATGDPVFNRLATALHLPCLSLPYPQKDNALPLGVQLVGAFNRGDILLSHGLWLETLFNNQKPSR
ncbi:MAG: amidase [Gammaproteobacteria bacterium]|nr:amidase [Gammaproteobacteria bacterium]